MKTQTFSTFPSESDDFPPLIEVRQLEKNYGPVHAVKGVDFQVGAGEIVGLLGPNGSGKTTIQRMTAGMIEPTAGTVRIYGKSFSENTFEIKSFLGYRTGDTKLYDRLTAREILRFFGSLYRMPPAALEARITVLLEILGIHHFADRRTASLSSGEKQRIALAQTILHDPRILILDEVTASLDIISARYVMEYLMTAKQEGKGILFSTHIMSEAEYLCDRILLLYEGRIIAQGTLEELLLASGTKNLTECFFAHTGANQK